MQDHVVLLLRTRQVGPVRVLICIEAQVPVRLPRSYNKWHVIYPPIEANRDLMLTMQDHDTSQH